MWRLTNWLGEGNSKVIWVHSVFGATMSSLNTLMGVLQNHVMIL